MPIVELTLVEGRSNQKKTAVVKSITEAIVTALEVPPETVRIIIREIPGEHFAVAGVQRGRAGGDA